MAGARDVERAGVRIDDRVEQGHHAALLALQHEAVHPLEHQLRPQRLERVGAKRALQMGHPCRGLHPAPHHVPDRDPHLAAPQRDRVVPVATDPALGASGPVAGREPEPGDRRQPREQAPLQRLRHLSLDLNPVGCALERIDRRAEDRVALGGIPADPVASSAGAAPSGAPPLPPDPPSS